MSTDFDYEPHDDTSPPFILEISRTAREATEQIRRAKQLIIESDRIIARVRERWMAVSGSDPVPGPEQVPGSAPASESAPETTPEDIANAVIDEWLARNEGHA